MDLEPVLDARPVGTFSLAGAQMKVSAQWKWKLQCPACGLYAIGHIEGGEVDPCSQIMTGGHLVAERVVRRSEVGREEGS
jgi:hypothetical protein